MYYSTLTTFVEFWAIGFSSPPPQPLIPPVRDGPLTRPTLCRSWLTTPLTVRVSLSFVGSPAAYASALINHAISSFILLTCHSVQRRNLPARRADINVTWYTRRWGSASDGYEIVPVIGAMAKLVHGFQILRGKSGFCSSPEYPRDKSNVIRHSSNIKDTITMIYNVARLLEGSISYKRGRRAAFELGFMD